MLLRLLNSKVIQFRSNSVWCRLSLIGQEIQSWELIVIQSDTLPGSLPFDILILTLQFLNMPFKSYYLVLEPLGQFILLDPFSLMRCFDLIYLLIFLPQRFKLLLYFKSERIKDFLCLFLNVQLLLTLLGRTCFFFQLFYLSLEVFSLFL